MPPPLSYPLCHNGSMKHGKYAISRSGLPGFPMNLPLIPAAALSPRQYACAAGRLATLDQRYHRPSPAPLPSGGRSHRRIFRQSPALAALEPSFWTGTKRKTGPETVHFCSSFGRARKRSDNPTAMRRSLPVPGSKPRQIDSSHNREPTKERPTYRQSIHPPPLFCAYSSYRSPGQRLLCFFPRLAPSDRAGHRPSSVRQPGREHSGRRIPRTEQSGLEPSFWTLGNSKTGKIPVKFRSSSGPEMKLSEAQVAFILKMRFEPRKKRNTRKIKDLQTECHSPTG